MSEPRERRPGACSADRRDVRHDDLFDDAIRLVDGPVPTSCSGRCTRDRGYRRGLAAAAPPDRRRACRQAAATDAFVKLDEPLADLRHGGLGRYRVGAVTHIARPANARIGRRRCSSSCRGARPTTT